MIFILLMRIFVSELVSYRPLLVNIGSVLQQVHHTVKVSFPGCPDKRGGPVLPQSYKGAQTHVIVVFVNVSHVIQHPWTLTLMSRVNSGDATHTWTSNSFQTNDYDFLVHSLSQNS